MDNQILAKYPFLHEATDYLNRLDLKIKDLDKDEYKPIVDRAAERLTDAIIKLQITTGNESKLEISSFPVATVIAAASANPFVKRRYALAEAQRVYASLKTDSAQALSAVAAEFWGEDEFVKSPPLYRLKFTVYLRNAVMMKEEKWSLTNRKISNGFVLVTRDEACRLLSEEVKRHIEDRIETATDIQVPKNIKELAKQAAETADKRMPEAVFPTSAVSEAFPPCIKKLCAMAQAGRHLSHVERFTLTSFMTAVNMPIDEVVAMFRNSSDFNEALTHYQVEHIAGETGSRTKYLPPNCKTLKTYAVCTEPDELCRRVRHALSYYRRALRRLKAQAKPKPKA